MYLVLGNPPSKHMRMTLANALLEIVVLTKMKIPNKPLKIPTKIGAENFKEGGIENYKEIGVHNNSTSSKANISTMTPVMKRR